MTDIQFLVKDLQKTLDLKDTMPVKEILSTGSISLDDILGGGYPSGRIVEMFGQESCGKSTLAVAACVQAQKKGWDFAYFDAESAFDLEYARKQGLRGEPNKDWILCTAETGEDVFWGAEECFNKGVPFIVVDSLASLTTHAELEGDYGDANVGALAKLTSQACRRLVGLISRKQAILLILNQTRQKPMTIYGSSEYAPGGNALKFYASVRVQCRRHEILKNADGQPTGIVMRCKTVKNKVSMPFKECDIPIFLGEGVDKAAEEFDRGLADGTIERKGSFYCWGDYKVNGKQAALEVLRGISL